MRSVGSFDDFFGHAIQSPAAGVRRSRSAATVATRLRSHAAKTTATSTGPSAIRAPSSVIAASTCAGASCKNTLDPGFTPSFFARGVPE